MVMSSQLSLLLVSKPEASDPLDLNVREDRGYVRNDPEVSRRIRGQIESWETIRNQTFDEIAGVDFVNFELSDGESIVSRKKLLEYLGKAEKVGISIPEGRASLSREELWILYLAIRPYTEGFR